MPYKCARCNDYLEGHTCKACNLRHRCHKQSCECQAFPLLPAAFGHEGDHQTGRRGIGRDHAHENRRVLNYYANARERAFNSPKWNAKNKRRLTNSDTLMKLQEFDKVK